MIFRHQILRRKELWKTYRYDFGIEFVYFCKYKYYVNTFAHLPISFLVLLCYSLVDMRANLGASVILIWSSVSGRRELPLCEHKLENLFFFACLWSHRKDLIAGQWLGKSYYCFFRSQLVCSNVVVHLNLFTLFLLQFVYVLHNRFHSVFKYWCFITYPAYFPFIQGGSVCFSVSSKSMSFRVTLLHSVHFLTFSWLVSFLVVQWHYKFPKSLTEEWYFERCKR